MRLKLALLTTAMAFGFGSAAALAEEAPGAKSDITIVADTPGGTDVPGTSAEGKGDAENPGALSAPEKDDLGAAPNGTGEMSDDSAANVPGAGAEGDSSAENQGALSAPEKDVGKGAAAEGGMTEEDKM